MRRARFAAFALVPAVLLSQWGPGGCNPTPGPDTTTTPVPPPAPTTAPTAPPPAPTTAPTAPPPAPTTAPTTPTTPPPGPPAPPPTGPSQFVEDFATSAGLDRFNWELFHGGIVDIFRTDSAILEWPGDHDHSCGDPNTTSRTVHVHADAAPGPVANMGEHVYYCAPSNDPARGHFMTSMNSPGYTHLDFSPAQSFNNVRRICWDQNLTELGGQKWIQVTVVSEAKFQTNGRLHQYVTPDQQSEIARNGIKLTDDDFMLNLIRGSTSTFVGQQVADRNFAGFHFHGDKSQRFRHCLTDLNNGTVQIDMYDRTGPGSVETRVQRGGWNDGQVRVIFQDITYHPAKDPNSRPQNMTWHWDNIFIQ